jgi:hypothetical protein
MYGGAGAEREFAVGARGVDQQWPRRLQIMLRKTSGLLRQLNELDRILDYLERMNVHALTDVPTTVTDMLQAAGLSDTWHMRPMILIPRVLDRHQLLRRQLAALRRTGAT